MGCRERIPGQPLSRNSREGVVGTEEAVCMTRHLHGCPETGEEEAKWQYLEQKKSGIGI